jgi:hypothetical protein
VIVELAAEVQAKLALASRLRTNKNEANAIRATVRELESFVTDTRLLNVGLGICRARLEAEDVAIITTQAAQIAQEIDASRRLFIIHPQERPPINNASKKLKTVSGLLAARWGEYAKKQLEPYLELRQLVDYLPEVAADKANIDTLVNQIKAQGSSVPKTEEQLAQFDQRLAHLSSRLDAIAHLPDQVRLFLSKVVANTATMADLSPEVLTWIREGNREGAFAIRFVINKV